MRLQLQDLIVQLAIQITTGITKHVNVNVKTVVYTKEDYSWNPSPCICENSRYLKSITDTSVIVCDEIISVMDIVSTKITNKLPTNESINFDDKKVRYKIDCYILHTILLVTILLLIITIICYRYAKHRSKQKGINALTI